MIELRDYQIEMLDRLQRTWREGKRSVMVQMPTGTGKTVLLAALLRKLRNEKIEELKSPFGEVLIVAHRRELIQQIQDTLNRLGIKNGKLKEKNEVNEESGFIEDEVPVVESIQKLTNIIKEEKRKEKNKVKEESEIEERHELNFGKDESGEGLLIIIDEAHHALAKTYRALWERWPKAKFLGLTATPCRLNGSAFTDLFDVLLQAKDIQWFIKQGWLSDFEYVSVQPDSEEMKKVRGLKKRGADGDYQTKEMATVLDVPESIEHLYHTYNLYARGKKGIVYAIDRAHAQHIAEYYSAKGIRACCIEAQTPAKERERLVREYREGRMDVIVNVDIFSEGFDCPEVEFIQLARPTLSLAKYLQQVGRGMRVSKGKPFVTILDQVGLYQTFGMPTDNRDWQRMFQGKTAGKGLAAGEGRPLIIRDEVADKELLNLEMLHIKRFNERRTRLEVFLLNGRFGIMCMGHVTCSPQFRRIQRLHRSRYYALAVYDGTKEDYTTVIDNEGRNMRLSFRGEVSVMDDIFVEKGKDGKRLYYDAISRRRYVRFPQFQTVAGLEVEDRNNAYYLRDGMGKLTSSLNRTGTHYNEHVVITEDVLINKAEGNSQCRIQGYLEDSVLVGAERGIGFQKVFPDGRRSGVMAVRPKETSMVPDWERLGLRSLGEELRDEQMQRLEEKWRGDYNAFMSAMVERDQVWQDDNLDGSFQVSHDGHTASRPEFIIAEDVRFHKIETQAMEIRKDGKGVVFAGQISVKYQILSTRRIAEEVYDFRLRSRKISGVVWRFTRAWFSRRNEK